MKVLMSLMSAALLVSLSAPALAQATPSNRPCKQGEQMIGGVCKPLTRSSPRDDGVYNAPRSTGSTARTTSAGTTPSNRPCKRGEQMIGGVCKPLTRTPNR